MRPIALILPLLFPCSTLWCAGLEVVRVSPAWGFTYDGAIRRTLCPRRILTRRTGFRHDATRSFGDRCARPLACDAISDKRFDRHVAGDRPDGANFLDALAAFCPTDRPRL